MSSPEPTSPEWVESQLIILQQSNQPLTVSLNPAYQYDIDVTEDLQNILCLSQWESVEITDTSAAAAETMLYFDLPHSENSSFSRIAILSNGYALIQECSISQQEMIFEEKHWYRWLHANNDLFKALVEYIDTSQQ